MRTIEWKNDRIVMIDQRKLPGKEIYFECHDFRAVAFAIKKMVIRGAPAIGVAAAMGIALGAQKIKAKDFAGFKKNFNKICEVMKETRPTAVNLFWSIQRMNDCLLKHEAINVNNLKPLLKKEAIKIMAEDIAGNYRIGENGKAFIKDGDTVLTHCNAGALATAGFGTALGIIRAACSEGKNVKVISCETRPFFQGARLTTWELMRDNIPVTLITDNMAACLMRKKEIASIIVGADRIAANGDVINKIGTYSLAILAKEHKIPFYVAAPVSSLDLSMKKGDEALIEERDEEEVTMIGKKRIAPQGIRVLNPAFDVTPFHYITGIVTDRGLVKPPLQKHLKKLLSTKNYP